MGLKYSVFTNFMDLIDKIQEAFHSLKTSGLV